MSENRTDNVILLISDSCLTECEEIIKHSIDEIDNPALSASTSAPDYFRDLIGPTLTCVTNLEDSFVKYSEVGDEKIDDLAGNSIRLASSIGNYVVQGKTTSNSSRDIEFGESRFKVWLLDLKLLHHGPITHYECPG